jgi:hypothetical protein
MKLDKMLFEVLPNGLIKVTTDPISGVNHVNADQFLRLVQEMAGGETTIERRKDVRHQHSHEAGVKHQH